MTHYLWWVVRQKPLLLSFFLFRHIVPSIPNSKFLTIANSNTIPIFCTRVRAPARAHKSKDKNETRTDDRRPTTTTRKRGRSVACCLALHFCLCLSTFGPDWCGTKSLVGLPSAELLVATEWTAAVLFYASKIEFDRRSNIETTTKSAMYNHRHEVSVIDNRRMLTVTAGRRRTVHRLLE